MVVAMVLCGMGSSLFPFSFLRIPSSAFLGSVPDIFEYMTTLLFFLLLRYYPVLGGEEWFWEVTYFCTDGLFISSTPFLFLR